MLSMRRSAIVEALHGISSVLLVEEASYSLSLTISLVAHNSL
jgi:hypothetical protein